MSRFQHVQPGDAFTIGADDHNGWQDTARSFLEGGFPNDRAPRGGSSPHFTTPVRQASGEDRKLYEVLAIDGLRYPPSDNLDAFFQTIYLNGVTPTATHRGQPFVVLQKYVESNEIADAAIGGITRVKLDVNDEDHEYADVVVGECGHLESSPMGFARIIAKEHTSGIDWAIVQLGVNVDHVTGRLKANQTFGDTDFTIELAGGAADLEGVSWDHHGETGDTLDANTWCTFERSVGEWRLKTWPCPNE